MGLKKSEKSKSAVVEVEEDLGMVSLLSLSASLEWSFCSGREEWHRWWSPTLMVVAGNGCEWSLPFGATKIYFVFPKGGIH